MPISEVSRSGRAIFGSTALLFLPLSALTIGPAGESWRGLIAASPTLRRRGEGGRCDSSGLRGEDIGSNSQGHSAKKTGSVQAACSADHPWGKLGRAVKQA